MCLCCLNGRTGAGTPSSGGVDGGNVIGPSRAVGASNQTVGRFRHLGTPSSPPRYLFRVEGMHQHVERASTASQLDVADGQFPPGLLVPQVPCGDSGELQPMQRPGGPGIDAGPAGRVATYEQLTPSWVASRAGSLRPVGMWQAGLGAGEWAGWAGGPTHAGSAARPWPMNPCRPATGEPAPPPRPGLCLPAAGPRRAGQPEPRSPTRRRVPRTSAEPRCVTVCCLFGTGILASAVNLVAGLSRR
ncbi:MAG: hypothetical protein JWR58_5092 [Pseudonocardia sp.]|nr:hypothetical protein [Pseudonocardia sp.]